MKKLLFVILAIVVLGSYAWADEKSELTSQLNALQWEMNYIQARIPMIQSQAKEIGAKLQAIQQAEEKSPKEKVEKNTK